MRDIPTQLKDLQRRSPRRPVVDLQVATYGHPAAVDASKLEWESFSWERLTPASDATPVGHHTCTVAGDGSLFRVSNQGGYLKRQRIPSPSPSSDWATWNSSWGASTGSPLATAAYGSQVIFVTDQTGSNLVRLESNDYGATFGGAIPMLSAPPCERGLAMAYKSNGDLGIVHASDVGNPQSLYFVKRVSGTWYYYQIMGDYAISGLALYHNGDWNILALLLDGSYIRLARGIYGDGHQYAVGVFSGFEFINSYKARVDFTGQVALRQWRTRGSKAPTYYEKVSAVNEMRAADNLGVDDPYLVYHPSLGAAFSFTKDNKPWLYRLRPLTEFKDSDWYRAWPLDVMATYGLSLCCDGTYLYAEAPNQVWRTLLPGAWSPPTAGSGAGTYYSIPGADVLAVREKVESLAASSLEVVLNNAKGQYNSAGSGSASLLASLKRGSEVSLSLGYRRGAVALTSLCGRYYIESLGYRRRPGESHFIISCIDAWGLLERFAFNRPVEWNAGSNAHTVYDLIALLVQAVGGSLSYVSRSPQITAIYPYVDIHAGQNAAQVLQNLLQLVPDVIYFVGLQGYIVYPQSTDQPTYMFKGPE